MQDGKQGWDFLSIFFFIRLTLHERDSAILYSCFRNRVSSVDVVTWL